MWVDFYDRGECTGYKLSMLPDPSLVAAPRPERGHSGRWGLYSPAQGRWLEVVFGSEHEANESLKVLQRCKPDAAQGRTHRGG